MDIKQVTVGIIGTKGERKTAVFDAVEGKVVVGSIDTIIAGVDCVARVGEPPRMAPPEPAAPVAPPVRAEAHDAVPFAVDVPTMAPPIDVEFDDSDLEPDGPPSE